MVDKSAIERSHSPFTICIRYSGNAIMMKIAFPLNAAAEVICWFTHSFIYHHNKCRYRCLSEYVMATKRKKYRINFKQVSEWPSRVINKFPTETAQWNVYWIYSSFSISLHCFTDVDERKGAEIHLLDFNGILKAASTPLYSKKNCDLNQFTSATRIMRSIKYFAHNAIVYVLSECAIPLFQFVSLAQIRNSCESLFIEIWCRYQHCPLFQLVPWNGKFKRIDWFSFWILGVTNNVYQRANKQPLTAAETRIINCFSHRVQK